MQAEAGETEVRVARLENRISQLHRHLTVTLLAAVISIGLHVRNECDVGRRQDDVWARVVRCEAVVAESVFIKGAADKLVAALSSYETGAGYLLLVNRDNTQVVRIVTDDAAAVPHFDESPERDVAVHWSTLSPSRGLLRGRHPSP